MAFNLTGDWLIKWCFTSTQDHFRHIEVIYNLLKKCQNCLQIWLYFNKVWHILDCMMFYMIHSLTRSVIHSYWDVTMCRCTVSDSDPCSNGPLSCQGCGFQGLDKKDLNIHLSVIACLKILWELGEHCHNN